MFLQETHCIEKKDEFQYNCNWSEKSIYAFSDSNFSRGGSILLKKNARVESLDTRKSVDGRKLLFNVKINEQNVTLVNVYASNKDTSRIFFFKRLKTYINIHKLLQSHVILCGDFNCNMNNINEKVLKFSRIVYKY